MKKIIPLDYYRRKAAELKRRAGTLRGALRHAALQMAQIYRELAHREEQKAAAMQPDEEN